MVKRVVRKTAKKAVKKTVKKPEPSLFDNIPDSEPAVKVKAAAKDTG